MELLGESLGDIHRRAPKRQLSINTVLRIGHQTFQVTFLVIPFTFLILDCRKDASISYYSS